MWVSRRKVDASPPDMQSQPCSSRGSNHTPAEIKESFDAAGVLWGVYQDLRQLVDEVHRCSLQNQMFTEIEQAGWAGV